MADRKNEPTKAEMLAAVINGTSTYGHVLPTVQRSHRFPFHLLTQIENMARIGGVPMSLVINELLESGLDAVKEKLPDHVLREVVLITDEQSRLPKVMETIDVNPRNVSGKKTKRREK